MENDFNLNDFIDEYGVNKGTYFQRNIYHKCGDIIEQNKFVQEFKAANNEIDLYKRIYSSETEDTDTSKVYGPLYLDFDCDNIDDKKEFIKVRADVVMVLQALEDDWGIPKEMIRVYFSGSKGFHIMISPIVFGGIPKVDLNMDYKIIAMEMRNQSSYKTIDTRIYDKRRLFRIENTINSKCNLYKIPLYPDEIMDYDYEALKEIAKTPRMIRVKPPEEIFSAVVLYKGRMKRISQYKITGDIKKAKKDTLPKKECNYSKTLLPCIVSGIEEGAPTGSRNNILVALSSSLFQFGQTYEQVLDLMYQWNEANEDSLTDREVNTTVKSAQKLFETGKKYGCDAFKSLGLCVGSECKLFDRTGD